MTLRITVSILILLLATPVSLAGTWGSEKWGQMYWGDSPATAS